MNTVLIKSESQYLVYKYVTVMSRRLHPSKFDLRSCLFYVWLNHINITASQCMRMCRGCLICSVGSCVDVSG